MDEHKLERDDRVILFGKALTLDGGHYQGSASTDAPLISLGYFDSLRVCPLRQEENDANWLKAVRRHSIELAQKLDAKTYHHPLYIFKIGEAAMVKKFWSGSCQFLFVTLVHFRNNEQQPARDQWFRDVEEDIKAAVEGSGVQAICYQSLDLSDMVVLWNSDSLREVLGQLQRLYQHPSVGNMRTLCGFSSTTSQNREAADQSLIPYVSFRFCVNNADAVEDFTRRLRERCPWWPELGGYFTTGSEDLNVVFQDLSERRLLQVISLWFFDPAINNAFQEAFYESSTHLGVHLENNDSGRKKMHRSQRGNGVLTERCVKLFTDFQEVQKAYQASLPPTALAATVNTSWCKAVCNQLNALVDMSRIPVLDGFCYIILDGAKTFCRLLKEHATDTKMLSAEFLGRLQRFVRGWGVLMDQAVRVDGQFIQTPGFSPVLYDIPVELQEFYIGFASRCMELMQTVDRATAQHHYALFLLPKLCRRTKVEDVFQDPAPCSRLLYVDVPVDLLYDPMQILPQLCHEVSHYCGETIRCRAERAKHVLMSCAYLMAYGYLGWRREQTIQGIYASLCEAIDLERAAYMDGLKEELENFLRILPQKVGTLARWWRLQVDSGEESDAQLFQNPFGSNETLDGLVQQSKTLLVLFKEGYADVSMIYLLDLSWEEYLPLYQQELFWLPQTGEKENSPAVFAEFVQRAALVLHATGRRPPQVEPAGAQTFEARFAVCVAELYQILEEAEFGAGVPGAAARGMGVDRYYFPVGLLLVIRDYLSGCYDLMRKELDAKNDMREVFHEVARRGGIGSCAYREILQHYEEQLLKES